MLFQYQFYKHSFLPGFYDLVPDVRISFSALQEYILGVLGLNLGLEISCVY
jgi:hypothetical protein